MALQAGDVINFARLAWKVYEIGWSEQHNATRQYVDFGKDVRGLAESLNILNQVVTQASSSLRQQGAPNATLRWDQTSLDEIVGDYTQTLEACKILLEKNKRYRLGTSPLRNIDWHVLVQSDVNHLRQRIQLHNSKLLHVLNLSRLTCYIAFARTFIMFTKTLLAA
jgi:hypothetical protein